MGCLEMACANFADPMQTNQLQDEKQTPSIESLIDVNHANWSFPLFQFHG